jgi:predicted N-acetyltransferase YhbS
MSYTVKLAETEQEYLGIRRLNHQTFAEELGQHETAADELLVDRFEHKSRYLIATHAGAVVGMVAIHDQPPFSISQRLPDASLLERLPGRKLEVRLLAIDPAHRNRMVFAALLCNMIGLAIGEGYQTLLISGIVERESIYRRFGFTPLGPPALSGKARYIPMLLRIEDLPEKIRKDIQRWGRRSNIR